VLNHAGDWTALINRSDTDILIEAFVNLAKQNRNLNFIIRCHPTMIHPLHEGINSINRIKEFIEWVNLKNLSVSTASLSEDISRGDLFISEYSQVLIDILQNGKLGIIANLTNRRSFMIDYESIGFLNVNSSANLNSLLQNILNHEVKYVSIQNKAVEEYNSLLKAWLSAN
jgi:hypothetical protein